MGEEKILVENDFTMPTSFPVLGKLLGLSNDDAKDILLDPWDRSHGNGKWNQKSASLHLYCPYRWCLKIPFWVVALGQLELDAQHIDNGEYWVMQRAKQRDWMPQSLLVDEGFVSLHNDTGCRWTKAWVFVNKVHREWLYRLTIGKISYRSMRKSHYLARDVWCSLLISSVSSQVSTNDFREKNAAYTNTPNVDICSSTYTFSLEVTIR